MTGASFGTRLWRAARRTLQPSYWQREITAGRVLKPAYVSLGLRWCTWAIALVMAVSGFVLPANMTWTRPLLVVTGIWLLVQTLYLPVLRFSFPPPARRRGLARTQVIHLLDRGAVLSAVEVLASGLILFLTGGWGSPFYLYGLSSVVMPALLFGYRAALLAGSGFSLLFVLSVLLTDGGFDQVAVPGLLDGFIGYTLVPLPFALFAAYLGRVTRQLEAEGIRGRRALAEAQVLQAVTASGLRHVADPERFIAETLVQVRRWAHLRAFAIVYQLPRSEEAIGEAGNRSVEAVAGFGPPAGPVAAVLRGEAAPLTAPMLLRVPLAQGDRHLGTLLAEAPQPESQRLFVTSLAGQISAALANAHLHAETRILAAQAERTRLAREIHDGIAQSLFMLTLNLETCTDLAERDPARLRERLELLTGVARQTLWQTRHYLHDLKPMLQHEQALSSALENQIREFRTVSGLEVSLAISGEERPMAPVVKQAVYRIAQEGLANVFKHARAKHVSVGLTFDADGMALVIEDDGQGFVPAADGRPPQAGFGLESMRGRAEEIGGQVTITALPSAGTTLHAWVPYQPTAQSLSASIPGHASDHLPVIEKPAW